MPLTAQFSQFTPPLEIASWLACVLFIVLLFNACAKAWFTMRGKPSPVEAAAATSALETRIAIIEKCIGSCKREQDRRLEELEKSHKQIGIEIMDHLTKVYNRLNPTAETVAGIEGEISGLKDQIALLITTLKLGRR